MSLLVAGARQIATPRGRQAVRGAALDRLDLLDQAVVRCEEGRIVFLGSPAEHARPVCKVIEKYLTEDTQASVRHCCCSASVNSIQSNVCGW